MRKTLALRGAFSLVCIPGCRHKDAKAHRHKEKKGQSDKGAKAQSRKIRPLCPFVPQAVGFRRQQWAAQGVFSEEAELACLKSQSRPIGQMITSKRPWIENGNHPKEDNQ
jgi:hypothetical protein